MNNQFLKLVLILTLNLVLVNLTNAAVYSVVISFAKVNGTENCWKIDYALMESHNDTNPLNDTSLGSFSCIVGSDCVGNFVQPSTPVIEIAANNIQPTYSFECYPNPSNADVKVRFHNSNMIYTKWTWTLVSENNKIVMKGEEDLADKSEFTLNTSYLRNGSYKLILISSTQNINIIPISIIK